MWGAGEEVESFNKVEVVFSEEFLDVAGFSGGVTREIDDFCGGNFEKFGNEFFVATGARRV